MCALGRAGVGASWHALSPQAGQQEQEHDDASCRQRTSNEPVKPTSGRYFGRGGRCAMCSHTALLPCAEILDSLPLGGVVRQHFDELASASYAVH